MEPEIYKKDQKYNIIYINKNGEEKEYSFTPNEDMTKPKIIMKCKEDNKDFVKLKEVKKLEEGEYKMNDNFEKYVDSWIEEHQDDIKEIDELDGSEAEAIVMDYVQETDLISYNDAVKQGYLTIAEDKLLKAINNEEVDAEPKDIKHSRAKRVDGEWVIEELDENKEDVQINTLADLIKSRDGEGLDIGDNNIDMIVYFEYDGDSNDAYDKCLKTIAEETKVIDIQDDYVVVDLYDYVKQHLGVFEEVLDVSGTNESDEIANIVESLEGVFSGFMTDNAYNDLYQALTNNKIEESIESGASIFELKFDCSNEDTFGTGYDLSVTIGKVLEDITRAVQEGRLDGPIMDINGNKIGSFGLGYEGVQSGLSEEKEIKKEDHQLYYDDIQNMNKEERHKLWMTEHESDFIDDEFGNDMFWDWVEEEFPVKTIEESIDYDNIQKLRDEIWEYIINDYHRLEDFTDLEMTEETNQELYDTAKNNLAKFNEEDLNTMLKEIKSGNIDLSDWGHKVL